MNTYEGYIGNRMEILSRKELKDIENIWLKGAKALWLKEKHG